MLRDSSDLPRPEEVPEYINIPGLGGKLLYDFATLSEQHRYGCCSIEFGKDDRYIFSYSSGYGKDAEERFIDDFQNCVDYYGGTPRTIHLLTKWNPCARLCSGAIKKLITDNPKIEEVYIGYAEPYISNKHGHSEDMKSVSLAVQNLNFSYTHTSSSAEGILPTTRVVCSMLGADVIRAAAVGHFSRRRTEVEQRQKSLFG